MLMCGGFQKSTLKVMLFKLILLWSLGKKKKLKALHEKKNINTSKAVLVKYEVKG